MSQLPAIGVDIGSKYMCFGIWERDRGEILANEEGKRTTAAFDGEATTTYAVYLKALNKSVSTCKEILGSDDIHDERRTISYAIRDVIRDAGMKNVKMCAAPILAAIAYGLENKPAGTVIFIFHLVVHHGIQNLKNHNGVEICRNERALSRVKTAVEKAKRALSFSCKSEVVVDGVLDGKDLQMYITRSMFEELNKNLFLKCIDTVDSCMEEAKLHNNDVDEVVVMGGSSRIPKLQELLANFFIGKELRNSIAPDEVVAYGATVRRGALAGFHPQNIGNLSPSRLSMLHGLLRDYMNARKAVVMFFLT
ncbi:hypothetical protein MIMGU_mgv1a017750mg [Erythranthe guttata]|uniref:Uncharacterized protein n=1 Tax=Erythranthe guttata TaxID=4155 RepID=A0A022RNQ9_ERYGU|nr:hypothetical protein MIMGU_mgv1a017750mg [Erythranthe guttata]